MSTPSTPDRPLPARRLPEPPMAPWQTLPSVTYESVPSDSPHMYASSSLKADEPGTPPGAQTLTVPARPAGAGDFGSPAAPSTGLHDGLHSGKPFFANLVEEAPVPVPIVIEPWTPAPLRRWFWGIFAFFLVIVAIALEVARLFSSRNQGWKTTGKFSSEEGIMHYVYTLPPVGVAMIFVGLWAWTDNEVKRMQPYVDLAHGSSPAERSLLLDYTRSHNFFVWWNAGRNKHYIVVLTTLMAIVALAFQPLAAALFTLRDTYITLPDAQVSNRQAIGLNQNQQFQDLTSFLGASGYASSAILYNLGDPNFVNGGYSVGSFDYPLYLADNGTLATNTTGILSDPGCRGPDSPVNMVQHPDGTGWNNSATFDGCTFFWEVDKSSKNLFGTEILPDCAAFANTDVAFLPVIFWFFTYQPTAMASVSMCRPSVALHNVAVEVDLHSGNLTSVSKLSDVVVGQGNFTGFAGNVTGPPLNGQAYNGLNWTASQLVVDPFVLQRANAIQLQLPAAVFQNAVQNYPGGVTAAFQNNAFAPLSAQVYTTYLAMIARLVYFVDIDQPLNVRVSAIQKRLWIDDLAAHLLVVVLLLLALFGSIVQWLHRRDRRDLRLLQPPGTIASAAAFTAKSDVAGLLDGQLRAEDMGRALAKYRFRMDPATMKVVTIEEGEEGYETARSAPWSRSTFAGLVDRFGDKEGESSLSDDGARGAWFGRLGSKRASMPLPMRRESARL